MLNLDAIFDPDGGSRPRSYATPAKLPAEWHLLWDERAAIREYDGRLPRELAEKLALEEIVEMIRQAGETMDHLR